MTAEYDKTVLLDLMKQPGNNRCIDCNAPHPQWASVNHGIFVCLNCSGEHRSLGVHISFVRSLTMDKWSEEQLTKMRTGGNAKALAFFKESPEYSDKMSITEKYNTHFASQYREKLRCEVEGKPFVPSAAPPPGESASASLRKPRGGGGSGAGAGAGVGSGHTSPSSFGNGPSRSGTPVSASSALGGQSNPYATNVQKTANEAFFATMGAANAGRSEDLPPSQGGKYGGFGSDPFPSPGSGSTAGGNSAHPSAMLSSRALPSLNELQADPLRALGRGWGLFSSTVAQASKTINESVIQPGISRAADPALQENLYSYVSSAKEVLGEGARRGGAVLGDGLRAGSGYARQQGLQVGDLGANYVDKYTGAGNGQAYDGYGAPGAGHSGYGGYGAAGQTSLESQESGRADMSYTQAEQQQRQGAHDDFFDSQLGGGGNGLAGLSLNPTSASSDTLQPTPPVSATAGRKSPLGRKGLGAQKATPISRKTNDDDDDWGKFD